MCNSAAGQRSHCPLLWEIVEIYLLYVQMGMVLCVLALALGVCVVTALGRD